MGYPITPALMPGFKEIKPAGLKPLFMGYPITPALMPGFKEIKPAGLQPKIF
jgi:hypothetical protein